jgi:hypothetical protein
MVYVFVLLDIGTHWVVHWNLTVHPRNVSKLGRRGE